MITKNDIINNEVRALSWKQPYADLMLIGKQETRRWKTNYRGLVLICSSKAGYNQAQINFISGKKISKEIDRFYELNMIGNDDVLGLTGKAIAIGRLTDCRPMVKEDEKTAYVIYYPDLYIFNFEDVTAIIPFDWKGSQGWKTLYETEKEKIKM